MALKYVNLSCLFLNHFTNPLHDFAFYFLVDDNEGNAEMFFAKVSLLCIFASVSSCVRQWIENRVSNGLE
jgi:hypothetical protein